MVIIGGGYYWYHTAHPTTTQVQYKTAAAEKGAITTSVSASGNVIVDESVNIDPTITGTVVNLSVNVGDSVKKGQLLFNIDNDQLGIDMASSSASLMQSKQSLESAKASKKQADYDLDHNKSGLAIKNILKNKAEAAEISLNVAKENVKVAEARYQNALTDARKRNVVAPIDGTVNAVNIKNGDDLSRVSGSSSNAQVPIIIGDLKTIKAQVQVNEVDIYNIDINQKSVLTFNAIDGLSVSGKVEKMDSLGTLTSGVVTYNVTISFDSLDPRIRPEMSVSATIITGIKQNIVIVPNSAVKSQNGQSYAQILEDGQKIPRQVSVEVGISNNTDTEIISGLNAGDKVVTQTISSSAATATSTSSSSLRVPGLGGGGRPD